MTLDELRSNVSDYIAGLSMGGANETVTNAIMQDVAYFIKAPRLTAALSDQVVVPSGVTDKDRLDFLDRCNDRLNAIYGTSYSWSLILNHNVNRLMLGHMLVDLHDSDARGFPSCRAAIDAEIRRVTAARATPPPPSKDNGPDTNGGET